MRVPATLLSRARRSLDFSPRPAGGRQTDTILSLSRGHARARRSRSLAVAWLADNSLDRSYLESLCKDTRSAEDERSGPGRDPI